MRNTGLRVRRVGIVTGLALVSALFVGSAAQAALPKQIEVWVPAEIPAAEVNVSDSSSATPDLHVAAGGIKNLRVALYWGTNAARSVKTGLLDSGQCEADALVNKSINVRLKPGAKFQAIVEYDQMDASGNVTDHAEYEYTASATTENRRFSTTICAS